MSWALFGVAVVAIGLMLVLYKGAPKFMSKWVWIPTSILAFIAGGTLILSPPGAWLTGAIAATARFLGSLGAIGIGAGLVLGGIGVVLVLWALLKLANKDAGMGVLATIVILPLVLANVSGSIADPIMQLYAGFGSVGQSGITELTTGG